MYKYHGRRAIQLTRKGNYKTISDKCNSLFGTNFDFDINPDEVKKDNLKAIVLSVSAFIINRLGSISELDTECAKENSLNKHVDNNDFDKVTSIINSAKKEGKLNRKKLWIN